jgi:hypothetical protein
MKKIETVYVAGPLTPKGYFSKHPAVDYLEAMSQLINYSLDVFFAGYDPFCPALDFMFFLKKKPGKFITEAMIKRYSKSWLKRSDALILTPGWQTSSGTIAELKVCVEEDIPVFRDLKDLEKNNAVSMDLVKKWIEKYS